MMRTALLGVGLLFSVSAVASTQATREYVDRRDSVMYSNAVVYVDASTNALSTAVGRQVADMAMGAGMTNAVRSVAHSLADYAWDAESEVCWRRVVSGGYIDYVAVTNIDLTLPENAAALEAAEAARRAR